MRNNNDNIFLFAGGLVIIWALTKKVGNYQSQLRAFIQQWEGFRSTPYWDVNAWRWGYGTEVPGSVRDPSINPGGTISKDLAMEAMLLHIDEDYFYLKPLINVDLNGNQWAALLSFSYNTGRYNADNLVSNINAQDWNRLEDQWKQYIYSEGTINQNLIQRRAAEWDLFMS